MNPSHPYLPNYPHQQNPNPNQMPGTSRMEQPMVPAQDLGHQAARMQGLPALIAQEMDPLTATLKGISQKGIAAGSPSAMSPLNPAMNVAPVQRGAGGTPEESGHHPSGPGGEMWSSAQGASRQTTFAQMAASGLGQALQTIDQDGPLALCLLGRDLTREIVNRTVDLFVAIKSLQLPISTETFKQQQEKQAKAQEVLKQIVYLFGRLSAVQAKVEQFQKIVLPENVNEVAQDLIPLVGRPNPVFDALHQTTTSRESYQHLLKLYKETRAKLEQTQQILLENINFFRQLSWEIGTMLNG